MARTTFAAAFSIALSGVANALPADQTAEGRVDDATLVLSVGSKVVEGDRRSRCALRLSAGSEQVRFRHGDRVEVWVYEADFVGDDEVFATSFDVSPLEVGAGALDREIDCSGSFGDDGDEDLELYAKARVEKQDCGFACRYDRPKTGTLTVEVVGDDGDEEDDRALAATEVRPGRRGDLVAADADWRSFGLQGDASVRVEVAHRQAGGAVTAWLESPAGRVVAEGVATPDGLMVDAAVGAGVWYAVVSPVDDEDPNFYDFALTVGPPEVACGAGDEERSPCGACGEARRTCGGGRWSDWGACEGEGGCRPGDTRSVPCARCGLRADSCGEDCRWIEGRCEGSGDCEPGEWGRQACGDGRVQVRECRDTCRWSAFGPCTEAACEPGVARACHEGPADVVGVGQCVVGEQVCDASGWGPCEGDEGPAPEDCGDGRDNDCDGRVDGDDLDCASPSGGGLGLSARCATDADCAGFECVSASDHPAFADGYCGRAGCLEPCTGGVCAVAFGQVWCLRRCEDRGDCRLGHSCADVGADSKACLPPCRNDGDCLGPGRPYCSPWTERCTDDPDVTPASPGGSADEGGFCRSSGRSWTWPAALLRR